MTTYRSGISEKNADQYGIYAQPQKKDNGSILPLLGLGLLGAILFKGKKGHIPPGGGGGTKKVVREAVQKAERPVPVSHEEVISRPILPSNEPLIEKPVEAAVHQAKVKVTKLEPGTKPQVRAEKPYELQTIKLGDGRKLEELTDDELHQLNDYIGQKKERVLNSDHGTSEVAYQNNLKSLDADKTAVDEMLNKRRGTQPKENWQVGDHAAIQNEYGTYTHGRAQKITGVHEHPETGEKFYMMEGSSQFHPESHLRRLDESNIEQMVDYTQGKVPLPEELEHLRQGWMDPNYEKPFNKVYNQYESPIGPKPTIDMDTWTPSTLDDFSQMPEYWNRKLKSEMERVKNDVEVLHVTPEEMYDDLVRRGYDHERAVEHVRDFSGGAGYRGASFGEDGTIYIAKGLKEALPEDVYQQLLDHEMGHLASSNVFKNPGLGGHSANNQEELIASELSAWHAAKLVNPNVTKDTVENVVNVYRRVSDNMGEFLHTLTDSFSDILPAFKLFRK